SARAAAGVGFAFGLGLFGGGFSWIYVALATFGGMPAPLAALATLVLCAYLALFPAGAGWLCARFARPGSGERLMLAAACWTIMEWLRSWFLSGVPWLALGYTQVHSPLAGYAPIGGVFLVGLTTVLTAALLAQAGSAARRL